MATPRSLEDSTRSFSADGVLFPIPVLSAQGAAEALACFDALAAAKDGAGRLIGNAHLTEHWVWRIASKSALVDVVEAILGPDIAIFGSLLTCKPGGDPAWVPWHQDGTQTRFNQSRGVAAWIALTHANEANGCMRIVRGSHHAGPLAHSDAGREDRLFPSSPEIREPLPPGEIVPVQLAPGEASLHHSDVVHGSEANRSAARRVGLIVRYVDATGRVQQARPLLRVRGSQAHPSLTFQEPPRG